jgi:hypothetical protein
VLTAPVPTVTITRVAAGAGDRSKVLQRHHLR